MAEEKPGEGLWGWLGRQVGHVKKAVKTDVTKGTSQPAQQPAPPAEPPKQEHAPPVPPETEPPKQVIYREEKAEEVDLPDRPGVKLRRTIIDEVIVEEGEGKDPEETVK